MANLTIQSASPPPATVITPVTPAGTAVGSDTVPVGAVGLSLYITNTSGASRTVLIGTPTNKDVYGVAVADVSVILATNGFRIIKLPADLADPNTGLISLGCDSTTGLQYAAFA